MIRVAAAVERVDGDDAWVRVRPREGGCGRCDEPGGCRSLGLAYALKAPNELFRIPNPDGARVGEVVNLQLDERAPLHGAILGYGLGAAFLLAGAACATFLAPSGGEDLYTVAGAMAGLGTSFGVNRWLIVRRKILGGVRVELVRGGECAGMHRSGRE